MYERRKYPVQGFTLIEIVVVIGMIAVLASIVLIAINPLRQFALARNAQRQSDVNALLNAVGERIAENRGIFTTGTCIASIPDIAKPIASGSSNADIRPCLVPAFISELTVDPVSGNNTCTTTSCTGEDYDTGYTIGQDTTTGRITVCAPGVADETSISGLDPFCLTR